MPKAQKSRTPPPFFGEGVEGWEFYIIPARRKNKLGERLATTIFNMYPGDWQVRQIAGADLAKAFWRKIIKTFTQGNYVESEVNDPDWGVVTRQQFVSLAKDNYLSSETLSLYGMFSHASSDDDKKLINIKTCNKMY